MAQKPETRFRARLQGKLKGLPNLWFTSIQQASIYGTPDIWFIARGFGGAIECKKDAGEKPTALQKVSLIGIEKAGGIALVAYPENEKEIVLYLEHITKGGDPNEYEDYLRPFAGCSFLESLE